MTYCEIPFNHHMDDDSFLTDLNIFFHDGNTLNANQVFTPFESFENFDNIFDDIDPDLNFFNSNYRQLYENTTSNYYTEGKLNNALESYHHNCFSMMHLNVRSLPRHHDQLTEYLQTLNIEFTVIGLTETWLTPDNLDLFGLNNYKQFSICRENRRGGGVSLFVKQNLHFTILEELNCNNDVIECIFIEISKDALSIDHDLIIGNIYRPPNTDINNFIEILSNILEEIDSNVKLCYLMGDYNINLLNHDSHAQTSEFLDSLYSYSYFPLITKPTRVSSSSATLIDNIFCNRITDCSCLNGILRTDISDHYPIFSVHSNLIRKEDSTEFKCRILSQKNIDKFSSRLSQVKWNNIIEKEDCCTAFNDFYSTIEKLHNESFPLRTRKSTYCSKLPWLSQGLKESIKHKNRLFCINKKEKTEESLLKYKKYKSRLNGLLRRAKKDHYHSLFKSNEQNVKKSWAVMKTLINKTKSSEVPLKLLVNGHHVSDKNVIANKFNNYFVNIGNNLAKNIPESTISPTHYLNDVNITQSIYLQPVDENEVKRIILNLKNSSPGHDGMSSKVIKQTYHIYLPVLVHLLNLSITQGYFPPKLKIAKVVPLFKSGNSELLSNYRPVSILPCLSKIFEKIIYTRIMTFFEDKKLFSENQFGFRENRGTTLAILTLINKVVTGFNENKNTLGVFLDFRKAFDTVNHKILLKKLDKYGIRGNCLKLIESYLSNRQQFVQINEVNSSMQSIHCGVPQGSILGPLLFLCYINDISLITKKTFIVLFADDSNVFVQGADLNNMVETLNMELEKINKWLVVNKLSLNIDKTFYMLFRSQRLATELTKEIYIAGKKIDKVKYIRFLGIYIDESLTWEYHSSHIRKKIAKGIGIIGKVRKYLSKVTLRILYFSFIHPYISFGIESWGCMLQCHMLPILKLQKRVIRMITFSNYLEHTGQLFLDLNILNVFKVYMMQICLFMFKVYKSVHPDIILKIFQKNHEIHSHETRSSDNFRIPFLRLVNLQRSFMYTGVTSWNYIVNEIDINCSFYTFKNRLKHFLYQNYIPHVYNYSLE